MKVEKWIKCLLSDLGEIVGGATPSTKDDSNYGGEIAWITPKDLSVIKGRYISHGERSITEKGLKSCSAQMMPKNSVLFSSRAPIGYVAIAQNPVCTNQGFKSIVPNCKTDAMFLYYLLKYNKDAIEAMGSGTTFKEVSGSTMRNIEVSVSANISEQERIASVLSAIDSKIETNDQINDNLEQQAQALYQKLFVADLKSQPQNFHKVSLADLMDYAGGSQPPVSEFISEQREGYVRFVQIRDYESDAHAKVPTRKELFQKEALLLRQVQSLCSSMTTEAERHDAAYFEAVRSTIMKLTTGGNGGKPMSFREINAQINDLLKASIQSEGVINLFDSQDVGERFSLFEPSVLEEIAKMKEKNVVVEILRKLMAEQNVH